MEGDLSGVMTKACLRCEIDKPLDDFSPHKGGKQGRYPNCKSCVNELNRIRREAKAQREGRTYYPRPGSEEERVERIRRSKKRGQLKHKFGITLEQYEEMLERQEFCCAICGRHQSEFRYGLVVDHNHESGVVRSLLCQPCNAALGGFQDSQEILMTAQSYLAYHDGKSPFPHSLTAWEFAHALA